MRLQWITIHNTKVSDLSPLKGMLLSQIHLDFEAKRDGDFPRSFTSLQKIDDKPVGDFWMEVDPK